MVARFGFMCAVLACAVADRAARAHSDPEGDIYPHVFVTADGFEVWYGNNRPQRRAWATTGSEVHVDNPRFKVSFDAAGHPDAPPRAMQDAAPPVEFAREQLNALSYASGLDGPFAFDGRQWWQLRSDRGEQYVSRLDKSAAHHVAYDLREHSFQYLAQFAVSESDIVLVGQSCDFSAAAAPPASRMQLLGECASGSPARLALASIDRNGGKLRAFRMLGTPVAIWGILPVVTPPAIRGNTAYLFWIEDTDQHSSVDRPSARAVLTAFDATDGTGCDTILETGIVGNSFSDMKLRGDEFLTAYHDAGRIHVAAGTLPRIAHDGNCSGGAFATQLIPEMIPATEVP